MDHTAHEEIAAAAAAHRELGAGYDDAVAEGLVERIGAEIDKRVDARIAQRNEPAPATRPGWVPAVIGAGPMVCGVGATGIVVFSTARAAPLVWSVVGDEGARERYEHNEQLRQYGYTELLSILAGKHPLRPGLTPPRARDVLLVLTAPQLFVQFTRELGWSTGELAAWITTTVLEQVFATTQDPAPETVPRAP